MRYTQSVIRRSRFSPSTASSTPSCARASRFSTPCSRDRSEASHMGVCFNSYMERCCEDSYAAQLDYAEACEDFEGRGE